MIELEFINRMEITLMYIENTDTEIETIIQKAAKEAPCQHMEERLRVVRCQVCQ